MPWAPPALNTLPTPAIRAATSVAASTLPSGPGGVRMITSFTPATAAGIVVISATEGNDPLPRGT